MPYVFINCFTQIRPTAKLLIIIDCCRACSFPETPKSYEKFHYPITIANSTAIQKLSRQVIKLPYFVIRQFQPIGSNWQASSRQSCYAAGQSSAEAASDKVSPLAIVLQKLSLTDVTSCEISNDCKSGYTVHPVTFGPNPSTPQHNIIIIKQI